MRPIAIAFSYILLVALALSIYAPGLHGSFLFDDFANLPVLGATGKIDDIDGFWRYITSGSADPIGRPLALLSFLLDGHDWPTPALPFKRTNLVLHVAIGLMLAQFLRQLGWELYGNADKRPSSLRIESAALLAAAFWLLHPLFVSTTLYVVQREAMLPALFTLIGLSLWLGGRQRFQRGRARQGTIFLLIGLGICTLMATLSKANGILLPALALSIELILSATKRGTTLPMPCPYRRMMFTLAAIPTAAVATYLIYAGWQGFTYGISSTRPWTLGQRLLTEPRILINYLDLLWLPRPFTAGLFNDQIDASVSLWSPLTTLPALLLVLGLIGGAVLLRNRLPALAIAVLFYFVAQSMESSTIALELYFEHRNYLPALLMFWPLALWLCGVPQTATPPKESLAGTSSAGSPTRTGLKGVLTATVLIALSLMTYARASLWGNTHEQALLWARLNPESPRAQANAAQAEIKAGEPERAALRLQPALASKPDEVQLALNLLAARCQMGQADALTTNAVVQALGSTRDTGALLSHWFEYAIEQSASPPCPQMGLAAINKLLQAAMANPRLIEQPGRRQDFFYLQGRIALARKKPDIALALFNLALDQEVRATAAFQQAALLGSFGYPSQGLAHLAHYETERDQEVHPGFGMSRIHEWVLYRQHYWNRELTRLRNTLLSDERARDASPK